MAHPRRFELLTARFAIRYSIQLSYGYSESSLDKKYNFSIGKFVILKNYLPIVDYS